jgi:hypothetical protein
MTTEPAARSTVAMEESVCVVRIELVRKQLNDALGDIDGAALEGEAKPAIGARVVGVRDGAGDQVAANVGGVELPVAIVSAATYHQPRP